MEPRTRPFFHFLLAVLTAVLVSAISHADAAVVLNGPVNSDELYHLSFQTPGVVNPSYTFATSEGPLEVSFGTHFVGQAYGHAHNSLADTTPDGPLRMADGTAMTLMDMSNPNGVVLGGALNGSILTTPIAILFDESVSYVRFDLGHLDAHSDTVIEAFDTSGTSLGAFSGLPAGHNNFALAESDGSDTIAGISIYVPEGGMDWEGFAIDNIVFGKDGKTGGGGNPQVPEPATLIIWTLLGAVVGGTTWYHRRSS